MRTAHWILPVCVFFSWNAWSQPYTISTIAGTARQVEGSNAANTPLREPLAVAADASGNVYIADATDNRIRKVDKNGNITTYAGTGVPGYSGDRGPANLAQLRGPTGVALDGKGNLYISDSGNFVIRRISSDGTINTIAGNGNPKFGGDEGLATAAQIDPVAIAVDGKGEIYLADGFNYRIRKIDADGIITTIAGLGTPGYAGDNGPAKKATIDFVTALAADAAGNLYLADYYNLAVRKIDSTGMMTTIAGGVPYGYYEDGLPATQAVMIPTGVALDNAGNLYLSDADSNHTVIRRVDLATDLIYAEAGTGQVGFQGDGGVAMAAEINNPGGLAFAGGALYIADTGNLRIRKVSSNTITTIAGTSSRDNGPAASAFLNFPEGLAIDGAGNIALADTGNNALRRFRAGGNINPLGQVLGSPFGVAVDAAGNFYVTEEEPNFPAPNPHVLKVQPDGTTAVIAGNGPDGFGGDGGPARGAKLNQPEGIAVDAAGNIFLADLGNSVVRKIDTQGNIQTIAGNGKALFSGDGGLATKAGVSPADVALDGAGDIFVADAVNNRVRKITPGGVITTVAGNGTPGYMGDGGSATEAELNTPTGIAADQSGNLYIADEGNSAVRRVTTNGLITTIAGNGTKTPASGDGGPAWAAAMDPVRIALDRAGNVYVTDSFNDRVRMLAPQVVKSANMTVVSGDGQSAVVETALSAPLVLKVTDSTGAAIPGVLVTFTVSPEGAATVTPTPALTLNDGTVSLTVTLGSTPGPITITAVSYAVANVTFRATATSSTAPLILAGGITSAGLGNPSMNVLSPNAIVTIFGKNFAPDGQATGATLVDGHLPTNLAGVCVEFGTVRAPIFSVFPSQINVQVPAVTPGDVPVQVITGCDSASAVASAPVSVPAQATAPEFFAFITNADGKNPIAAVNSLSGGYVGAAGLISGATFTPAKPGDYITAFATGFGATKPSFLPGVLPDGIANVTAAVTIQLGGVTLNAAQVLYVGVSQFAGLYQVNLQVPDGVADGNQPLVITVGGVASSPNAYITVKSSK
jgi:uncharacterized protein (TIGR03437 family)